MRKNEMIDLLAQYATNERLDKIAFENPEYIAAREKTDFLLQELEEINSSKEAQKAINNYDSAAHAAAALYANIAYKQALKDMFNLIMSLLDKREETQTDDI